MPQRSQIYENITISVLKNPISLDIFEIKKIKKLRNFAPDFSWQLQYTQKYYYQLMKRRIICCAVVAMMMATHGMAQTPQRKITIGELFTLVESVAARR